MLADKLNRKSSDQTDGPEYNALDSLLVPAQNKTLKQTVIDQLMHLIQSGKLQAGQRIPSERELMRIFQVGRTTIREALHALVALGVLESRSGKGYLVTDLVSEVSQRDLALFALREADFLDLMEARERLEPLFAELAAKRATAEDLRRLEEIYAEAEQAAKTEKNLTAYTVRIHVAIGEATHNSIFAHVMRTIAPLVVAKLRHARIPAQEDLAIHRALIDELRKGKSTKLKKILQEHFKDLRKSYMELMELWEKATSVTEG